MIIRLVEAEFVPRGRKGGQAGRRTDMKLLIVTFRNFANATKKMSEFYEQRTE